MKCYGDIDLQQNELKSAVLEEVDTFPIEPKVGEMCFKSRIVYICSQITEGVPLWIPLTNELSTYVHTQSIGSAEWTVNHNLGADVLVQVIDANKEIIIPDRVINESANSTIIRFNNAQQGRAVIMAAGNKGGFNTATAHIHEQTEDSTEWIIEHGLSYTPICQVVLGDNMQIIPNEVNHSVKGTTVIKFTNPQNGTARLI